MKIPKAIELLKDIGPYRGTLSEDDLKAIKLGTAALKAIETWRVDYYGNLLLKLPGEDES